MALQKLKASCKLISVGMGIMTSYLTYQYQQTLSADVEKTVNKNISEVQNWFQWKSKKAYELTEEYLVQYCRQFSTSPMFHSMDITTFLIYLANSKTLFLHQLGVKLLSTVQFPEDVNVKCYIEKCDYTTLIGLARTKNVQSEWFPDTFIDIALSRIYVEEECDVEKCEIKIKVEGVLNDIRSFIPGTERDCFSWLYQRVAFHKLPEDPFPNVMVDLCTERDTLELSKGKQPCPFHKNVLTYMEILRGYSNNELVVSNRTLSFQILSIVKEIILRSDDHKAVLIACGNTIANLAVNETNRELITKAGLLPLLRKWKSSDALCLKLVADRILQNLDSAFHDDKFLCDGIYILNPDFRTDDNTDVDVIFVHGVHGNPFYTWRQNDACRSDDVYSYCWPKDWLCDDCPTARVICVQYESSLSDWFLSCPVEKTKYSLDMQSESLKKKLKECGVGEKPIVWVAHSMGGIIVEKLLLSAGGFTKNQSESITSSTKGIIFYSVPHLGSPIATKSEKARYVLFPSVEVHELSTNSSKLKDLHLDFDFLRQRYSIRCVDFGETQPLTIPLIKLKTTVVPEKSSNVGYGRFIPLDANHLQVCKPISKADPRYTEVVAMVTDVIKSNNSKEK